MVPIDISTNPILVSLYGIPEKQFFILRHILKNMIAKSSSQMDLLRSFFTWCLPIAFTLNSNIGKFRSRLGKNFQNSDMFVWLRMPKWPDWPKKGQIGQNGQSGQNDQNDQKCQIGQNG